MGYTDPESRRDRQLPGCGNSSVGPEPEPRRRRSNAQTRGKMQTTTLMNTAGHQAQLRPSGVPSSESDDSPPGLALKASLMRNEGLTSRSQGSCPRPLS